MLPLNRMDHAGVGLAVRSPGKSVDYEGSARRDGLYRLRCCAGRPVLMATSEGSREDERRHPRVTHQELHLFLHGDSLRYDLARISAEIIPGKSSRVSPVIAEPVFKPDPLARRRPSSHCELIAKKWARSSRHKPWGLVA